MFREQFHQVFWCFENNFTKICLGLGAADLSVAMFRGGQGFSLDDMMQGGKRKEMYSPFNGRTCPASNEQVCSVRLENIHFPSIYRLRFLFVLN